MFDVNTAEIAKIGNSRVHAFCGSVTNIANIDIVVTSENTDLSTASTTSTSVSGRIRDMAAERSATGEIVTDHINEFMQNWKNANQKFSNFPLGTCVICDDAFRAADHGVKTIIFAVGIRKNFDGTSTIEAAAISNIVKIAIDTAVNKDQRTVFIPVFGLGSGNTPTRAAIKYTVDAVKSKLTNTAVSVDVYIGVYRLNDLVELCMRIK